MHFSSIICNYLVIVALVALSIAQEQPFKINKLNLIWNKAQHSLGATKLKDLKNDLSKHEPDELSLKKLKAHNQDKDGLLEASVRKKLLSIMTKYSLERFFHDVDVGQATSIDTESQKIPVDVPTFRDSKLDKLWKKAEKAGFSQEQLMVLHEEFQHQQDKLDDHYDTLNMIEEEIAKAAKDVEKLENSIDEDPLDNSKKKNKKKAEKKTKDTKEGAHEKKARLESNMYQGLKDKHSEIKKSVEQLSKKIASGALDENAPFKEQRVNELWSMALKSNFSDFELDSLREELLHYQTRIEKLAHFQNQLERHEIGAKQSKSYADDDKEVKHIKKKVKELVQKVDKTDRSIEKKVLREEL